MDVNPRLFTGEEEKAVAPLSKDGGAHGLVSIGEVMTGFYSGPSERGIDARSRGVGLGGPFRDGRGTAICKCAQRRVERR